MNEKKFDEKGKVYAKARPDYPEALFWYLFSERVIDRNKIVADIGSGTGIFTIQLSDFVKTVFAVEPNCDMRVNAEKGFADLANIISVNATAEHTTLPDKSVDIITVAQAFHWFDREAFKTECRRILKHEGKVVLVWNDRDTTAEIIRDNFAVNKMYCPNFKGSSNGIDFSKNTFEDFFDGDFDMVEFDNSLRYDRNAFIARNLSSSYAPVERDACYREYISEIEKIFDKHNINGIVKYHYITRCYIGNVK